MVTKKALNPKPWLRCGRVKAISCNQWPQTRYKAELTVVRIEMTCHAKLVGQHVSCLFSWFYAFLILYLSIYLSSLLSLMKYLNGCKMNLIFIHEESNYDIFIR